MKMRTFDRFVVPAEDTAILDYALRHLFIPHGLRERVWSAILRKTLRFRSGRVLLRRRAESSWEPGSSLAREFRFLALRDYPGSEARGHILFLFGEEAPIPSAVLKLKPSEEKSVAAERDALAYVSRRLSAELKRTVPRPVAIEANGDWSGLLLTALPGRSLDFELSRRPASSSTLARHFEAAGRWLSSFHKATVSERTFEPARAAEEVRREWSRLAGGTEERVWLPFLLATGEEARFPLACSHGDFWARNVLVEPGGDRLSGVVDWEHFSREAPPFEDLFHFAVTYGHNYAWSAYQTESPEAAFRRAFLEENVLSQTIASFFRAYCDETGLKHRMLGPLFHFFLLRRGVDALSPDGRFPGDPGLWLSFHRMLARNRFSIFKQWS